MNKVSTNSGLKIFKYKNFKYKNSCTVKNTFTWEAKWTHIGLRFQTGVKTSSVQMKFHFSCISKRPDILMDLCRHFISGSVGIFYHPKWNFISVKMTEMKSISALSFKRTCALNATKSLRLFISFRVNYVHMKIQCRFDISFRSNWPVWKLYLFEI